MAESFASLSCYDAPLTRYDVYLSFCAFGRSHYFASLLRDALHLDGIQTCGVCRNFGQIAYSPTLEAIRESKMSIIIFSDDYASSKYSAWCLDELVEILECRKSFGRLVWPVFVGVKPSEVINQTGNFEEALAECEGSSDRNKEKLAKWKDALTQASSLSGWHLGDGAEFQMIQRIVGAALREVGHIVPPHFADYPVGIEDRMLELEPLIDVGTGKNDVRILGIYGIGGVGKTTIAKALFNKFGDEFEGSSFLESGRETSKQNLGLIQLLDELGNKHVMVVNTPRGIDIIRDRFCSKRVLVVLDGVDELDQQEILERRHEWFGLGSRIIITTRNKHLLTTQTHRADRIYGVQELDHRRALELFCRHAFKRYGGDHLGEDCLTLSDLIVRYIGGLPLALEVLGSLLHGREKDFWEDVIAYLSKEPNKKLYRILKLSFNTFGDLEKAIFHCIACFFVGENKYYVAEKLKRLLFVPPVYEIVQLIELCLIKVDGGRLRMHNLIEEMGKEIFYQESLEAAKHGRPWRPDRIFPVRIYQESLEAAKHGRPWCPDRIFPDRIFRNFPKKRIDVILKNDRRLAWREYMDVTKNIKEKVSDNGLEPLIKLLVFWVRIQLYKAKIFPNWGGHGSFSCLVEVDLGYCKSCYCLPPLGQLPFLKKLHIQGFDRVEGVGEEFYSTTDSLSSSKPFKSLESLTFSHMSRWKEWSFIKSGVFSDLKQLTLDNCRKLEGKCFPTCLPSLQSLFISGCKKQVVASLSPDGLPLLSFLKIGHCKELVSFPIRTLPANVDTVKIMGCNELVSLSEEGWPSKLKSLEISNCEKLFGNSLWWNLKRVTSLTSLQIIDIDEVVDSFPEKWQLPTTLESLTLSRFRNLQSLNGKALQHHTSLQELKIELCPHLWDLPEEGLPKSLFHLEIIGCNFLER